MTSAQRWQVGVWLLACALLVYLMVVVGGVTRLTQSGLSMVEWEPVMGVIPPLNEADWQRTFDLYKQFPEYQKLNRGMDLAGFKSIFWWEYGHRVLGRGIGIVFLLPLLFFALRGYLDRGWVVRLTGLFILGGLQGVMGWYMVMSGLVDNPHVSQYRLVAHLGLAVVIYGVMLWYAMDLLRGDRVRAGPADGMRSASAWLVGLIFLMILSGGFMAGTHAGYLFNTFPMMNGEWVPATWWSLQPGWRNPFENVVTIQLIHRALAMIIFIFATASVFALLRRGRAGGDGAWWLLGALALQLTLGIVTLLRAVPVTWAAAHQAGAIALLSAALYMAHRLRKQA